MLENGHSPNEVCFSCGYKDYSSFFRAYKNHFRVSPKKDIIKNLNAKIRCFDSNCERDILKFRINFSLKKLF